MIRDRCAARLHALLSIYDDLTPVRCVSSSYVLDRRSLRVRATRDPCNGTVPASPAYCALGKNYGKNFVRGERSYFTNYGSLHSRHKSQVSRPMCTHPH